MKPKGRRVGITTGLIALVLLALAVSLGWRDLVFWYRFERLSVNAQGLPEYRHRKTGIVFVRLPGGTFLMGAQKEDPKKTNFNPDAQDVEGPVHEVTLSPFLIGKYEVTQRQWKKVMGTNPSKFTGDDDRPVEQVSWDDIQGFEAKTGLALPTEAQWEYACRGGTTTPFAGTRKLDDMGWYNKNSGSTTHPVGKKAPNGYGLHDMHGNVWEWCEDVYDESFYRKPEAGGPDPVATSGSGFRVFRGGGWFGDARGCRSSLRGGDPPGARDGLLGCRLACRAP